MSAITLPSVINRRYELSEKLGAGGMGVVFRATDKLTRTTIALKRLTAPPKDLSFASKAGHKTDLHMALGTEFRTLSSLRHPHIVSVLDYGFDDQRQPYFTMEYLENAIPLSANSKNLPLQARIEMIIEMLQAIVYLHRHNILHRDLKPDNVLLVNGRVKVVDFGLSVEVTAFSGKYETENTAGTFAYMAPELFAGEPVTKASDLYAVGVIAYELLVGNHPFHTNNLALLINEIINKSPDLSSTGLDKALTDVLQRLLVKESDKRYTDAGEVILDLCNAVNLPVPPETTAIRESFLQAAQFIGRDHEMQHFAQILDESLTGQGSAWLVGGESGVGKSRLLEELRTLAQVKGALVLRGQAVREGGASYQVWRSVFPLLILHADLNDRDAALLKPYVEDIQALLGREIPAPPQLTAEQAQTELVRVVTSMFTQRQPVVIVLEDLQWAGSESLALLNYLSKCAANIPLLLIGNYRDDEYPGLPDQLPNHKTLKLPRLSKDDIKKLSVSMLGTLGEGSQVLDLLERETEGNVFFVVEVVRALAEYAGQLNQIGHINLPTRVLAGGVQEVVQRRLKRVPDAAYSLLQLAAIAGRDLDLHLLQSLDDALRIDSWLAVCTNAAVLDLQSNHWRFAHDKLREYLLDELSDMQRVEKYQKVAEVIETIYPDNIDQFGALAHLWHVAGDEEKELHYADLAGQQELKSGAYAEGIQFVQRALELLLKREHSRQRADYELQLQLLLGPALMNHFGYSHPSVTETYERAAQLGRETRQVQSVFHVFWGLWATSIFRGDYAPAQMVVKQMFDTAAQTGDAFHQLEAYHVGWSTAIWLGETRRAEDNFQNGIPLYDVATHRDACISVCGHDTGTCAYSIGTMNVWLLGYPELALQRSSNAESYARSTNHLYSRAHGYLAQTILGLFTRDSAQLATHSKEFLDYTFNNNFLFFMTLASVAHGWYLASIGRYQEALQQMSVTVEVMHRAKIYVYRPLVTSTFMDVSLMADHIDEGVRVFQEELEHFPVTGERFMESELRRLHGEILIRQRRFAEAEEAFQLALSIAHRQEAKSLELRAGISLAQLWLSQGRQQEAYFMLSDIYNWFTEGFATADLIDAKNLLDRLT